MQRHKVYICSPYSGNTQTNANAARQYARYAYEKGYLPITPHLYYPQFLDDSDTQERKDGLGFALEQLAKCKELWIFGDRISSGMQVEVIRAAELKIPIKYFEGDDNAR